MAQQAISLILDHLKVPNGPVKGQSVTEIFDPNLDSTVSCLK
jgi:hypothetical protein